jgi:hypothetical protein
VSVSYSFCVELCGWNDTQFGLCFAVVFIKQLVGEVVWSAKKEV